MTQALDNGRLSLTFYRSTELFSISCSGVPGVKDDTFGIQGGLMSNGARASTDSRACGYLEAFGISPALLAVIAGEPNPMRSIFEERPAA